MTFDDASLARASKPANLPTEAEVLQYFEHLSNKGRWGMLMSSVH